MIWSKALVVSIVWAIQRAAGAPYEPTIGPEILDMTSSSLLDHDRINASHPVSFRKRACPTGTTYTSLKDPFTSFDSEFWSIESGQGGLAYKTDGLHLTIDANIAISGGIVLQSTRQWSAPVHFSVRISTSEIPGIVYPFILKNSGDGGDEIDLEIVQETFQTPVWHNGQRLRKPEDVRQSLSHRTKEGSIFSYTYPGYDAKGMVSYELDWTEDSITWSVGGKSRVKYVKRSSGSSFPTGPLPIRFGVWATDPSADWAGKIDWASNPTPTMLVSDFTVEGCQSM